MNSNEHSNFGVVLQGDITHLKKIKKHILREYVELGLVKLSKQTYDKNKIYIITHDQWEEYQKLKKCKEEGLIGAWF
ncbi:MAG: hypothetical protein PVF58_07110 [Candidatus Methanofastidiosia archaeon]|jgi:hypothetical protein